MPETRAAKLFKNGSSQAVRLPLDFRFEGDEVYATRDERTGDVVLSKSPGRSSWSDLFALVHSAAASERFMKDRPLNRPPRTAGIFDDERDRPAPRKARSKR
jgi:antitoxin VapB